jgi:senataxin
MKKRTLVCAPTNVAVLQVASQLVELIEKNHSVLPFSFGDIVLFGNVDRMKVGKKLSKIFLTTRSQELSQCYSGKDGFKHHLNAVLQELQICDPRQKSVVLQRLQNTLPNSLEKLTSYTSTLLTHLPRTSVDDIKASVEKLRFLLCPGSLCFDESLSSITESCRKLMNYHFPDTKDCLNQATLALCTASMSSQLASKRKYEILVIDEAANLKECESMIPLQLQGFNNLFLVGDDRQLESVVKSKVCLRYKIIHSCSYFTYQLILYPFSYLLGCKRCRVAKKPLREIGSNWLQKALAKCAI